MIEGIYFSQTSVVYFAGDLAAVRSIGVSVITRVDFIHKWPPPPPSRPVSFFIQCHNTFDVSSRIYV